MPASTQPREPLTGFCRCHTSSNPSGSALGSSRAVPWKRTLAQCSGPSVTTSSRSASRLTTSTLWTEPACERTSSASAANISLVVTSRSASTSPRSFASCSARKLRFAWPRKPSTSNPAGMPRAPSPPASGREAAGDGGREQRAGAALREQPPEPEPGGEAGERGEPARAGGLRRGGLRLLLRGRGRPPLRRRGHLALRAQAAAAAEAARRVGLRYGDGDEHEREHGEERSFHDGPPVRTCGRRAARRRRRRG